MFRRRRTVTPEMRAEFTRMMAAAPTNDQVMAGVQRMTDALFRLAYAAPRQRRFAECGASDELEYYRAAPHSNADGQTGVI